MKFFMDAVGLPSSPLVYIPALSRIRTALIAINLLYVLTGIAMCILGNEIDKTLLDQRDCPHLWAIGVIPILIGSSGAFVYWMKHRKWVIIWLVTSLVIGCCGYVTSSVIGVLEPKHYDVTVHIFAKCSDSVERYCYCTWDTGDTYLLHTTPCCLLRHVTIVYLTIVCLFILCLVISMISVILTVIYTFCIQKQGQILEDSYPVMNAEDDSKQISDEESYSESKDNYRLDIT